MSYKCERCGFETNRNDILLRHLKRINICKPYLKDISVTILLDELKKPKQLNDNFICNICNLEFNSRSGKYRHQQKCNYKNNVIDTSNNIINNNVDEKENVSVNILLQKEIELLKTQIQLKDSQLYIKDLENKLNNNVSSIQPIIKNDTIELNKDKTIQPIINNETIPKINNITLSIDSTNSKIDNNINSNNNITNNTTNNNHNNTKNIIAINNDLTNIREYLESNNKILPYSKFDVSLLYDNDGSGLKDLIECDMEYSFKNHNDFLNYAMKKICFNCQTPRNINMYYDDDINKVVVKVADGITSNYNLNEIFNDFINQIKNIINKASKYHYEKNNIQISDTSYIDVKLKKYDNENSDNIIFFLDLVCENNLKFRDLYKFAYNLNNKTVKEETKLKRPIDLSLEGPLNFDDVDRFVFHTYHNKDFYRDTFNDTLYEHSTRKFIGPRSEYVHLQNGRDKYGNYLP
jgi:hypothetical protein